MKITHVDGEEINTDKFADVDAMLMEKSKELYELFRTYDRQLLLVGEMKGSENTSSLNGCVFFHVAKIDSSPEELKNAYRKFWWRSNGYIHGMSGGNLYIANHDKTE